MSNNKLFISGEGPLTNALRSVLGNQVERQEEANVVIVCSEETLRALHPGTDDPGRDFVLFSPKCPETLPSRTAWFLPKLTDLLDHLQKLSQAESRNA